MRRHNAQQDLWPHRWISVSCSNGQRAQTDTSQAALQYGYDTRGVVKTAYDANGLQLPGNAGLPPYTWYLATGARGERDDPDGGAAHHELRLLRLGERGLADAE
jgi:hypothetical protein